MSKILFIWKIIEKFLIFKVKLLFYDNIHPILARDTIRLLMVFTTTTNNTGENGDKKQNTLPYPLQFRRKEVCLVGVNRTIYTVTENACIFFGSRSGENVTKHVPFPSCLAVSRNFRKIARLRISDLKAG